VPMTIVVGARKYSGPAHQDSVDQGITDGKQYDIKSDSARNFYDGIKRLRDACIEKNGADKCCIEHLILDGHSTAGLGGREGLDKLTAPEIANLKSWLCKNATISMYGCFSFNLTLFPEYKLHLDMAMLLSEGGGTYEGFISTTQGLYPNVKSSDKDEKKPTKVPIPKGTTEDDVKKSFKKVDPNGQ
jgi:hypothetical protein